MDLQKYYIHYKDNGRTLTTVAVVENDGLPDPNNPDDPQVEWSYLDNLPPTIYDDEADTFLTSDEYLTQEMDQFFDAREVFVNTTTGFLEARTALENTLIIPTTVVKKNEVLTISNIPVGTQLIIEEPSNEEGFLDNTEDIDEDNSVFVDTYKIDDGVLEYSTTLTKTYVFNFQKRPEYIDYSIEIEVVDDNN